MEPFCTLSGHAAGVRRASAGLADVQLCDSLPHTVVSFVLGGALPSLTSFDLLEPRNLAVRPCVARVGAGRDADAAVSARELFSTRMPRWAPCQCAANLRRSGLFTSLRSVMPIGLGAARVACAKYPVMSENDEAYVPIRLPGLRPSRGGMRSGRRVPPVDGRLRPLVTVGHIVVSRAL